MSVRVYVEGGGSERVQQRSLRKAFSKLFGDLCANKRRLPEVICSGSCGSALREFGNAIRDRGDNVLVLLDSDGPVREPAWEFLAKRPRNSMRRPAGAVDDQLHLMVELMESWFLADRRALADYFGRGFAEHHLPGSEGDVEAIPKLSVEQGLKAATRPSRRGEYRKSRDSAELLLRIDAERLRKSAPHFRKLIDAINARLT